MLLAGLLTLLVPGAAQAEEAEPEEPTPLAVRLSAMSPAIPAERGRVVLRGVVRNDSLENWRDINVHPFVSSSPITSRAELAEAALTPATTEVGNRLTRVGTFASIGDLAPGESTRFVIRLQRKDLPISGAGGVYWIGVHALGLSSAGRDGTADGRARAFIPLVPRPEGRPQASASVALVLPVREPVRRTTDGRILDGDDWADSLAGEGRLGRLLAVAESAGNAAFTWLIDPAVLDAAQDIANGNPKLSYGEPRPTPSPSPAAAGVRFAITKTSQADAETWLDRLAADARRRIVLGLPYADTDVVGLARLRPQMLRRALILSEDHFKAHQIDAVPTYAPPAGWLAEEMWGANRVPLILGADHGGDDLAPQYRQPTGTGAVILGDSRAASGGPLPTAPTAALALRQRILADAALRALAGETTPMTVVLPERWETGPDVSSAAFFQGLDVPWLSLVGLDTTAELDEPVGQFTYDSDERAAEIGSGQISAAGALINTGAVLAEVVDTDNDVLEQLTASALAATSYGARTDSSIATLVRSRAESLQRQLDSVRVLGTEFNTLSSGAGRLTVTVVNELPHPVRLNLAVEADAGIEVQPPAEPVEIGPGQRLTMRLQTSADSIGVHDVTLTPVTTEGRPFGTALEMTVRTSQVGKLIWYVLAIGGGIFVVMIIRRIVKRIRTHRWKPPIT